MSSNGGASQVNEPVFARTLGLFDATMLGVGAMIGAGIFVLTGIATGEAGPASILVTCPYVPTPGAVTRRRAHDKGRLSSSP